jgi:carboxylate-amine ligase
MAQRHGVEGKLIDFGHGGAVPFAVLLEELIEWIAEDAEALGCLREVENARNIIRRGSSAARQIKTFEAQVGTGQTKREALKVVVDQLVRETVQDL